MSLKDFLLIAPSDQLDPCLFPLIKKWDDEPKAVQILEVLDHVIFAALGSGFVVKLLETLYGTALKAEDIAHEDVEKLAIWRPAMGAVQTVGNKLANQ